MSAQSRSRRSLKRRQMALVDQIGGLTNAMFISDREFCPQNYFTFA
jgi:hypothetical protein